MSVEVVRTLVIILEEDTLFAERMHASVCSSSGFSAQACSSQRSFFDCHVVTSIDEFFHLDPTSWDVVIVSSQCSSGSGFEVISFVKGIRPDVPVIVTGLLENPNEVIEFIHAGASEFLILTDYEIDLLPLKINKCLAIQKMQNENECLNRELNQSMTSLSVKNHALEQMVLQLEVTTKTDDLTKLYNRRWLNGMLSQRWEETKRHAVPLAFLMLDLDGFKNLNDQLGHQRGDDLLCITAEVLKDNCRSIDCSARYGGDEFCVVMPHTDPESAMNAARRISHAFNKTVAGLNWVTVSISISIGVAHVDVVLPTSAEELIRHADLAMYRAKKHKSHVVLFENERRPAA